MPIAALDKATIKFITSTQVITSVSSAVKELVENALDAKAKNVEVNLTEKGLSLIEVRDDGTGISKPDIPYMALPHYTSKISGFNDLESLESYGFRGEALAALCRVADVTVTTKTADEQAARSYTMNHDGNVTNEEELYRSVGTTVQVKQLFKDIPVRRQVACNPRRSTQDVKLIEGLLKSLGICQPDVRISYRLNNKVVFTKPSVISVKEALAYVVGTKVISHLDWLEIQDNEVKLDLMIPQKDLKDISIVFQANHQYILVNNRPVKYKQFEKVLNERISDHFDKKTRKKTAFFLSITVAPSEVDVNLEPNKTAVLMKNQDEILKMLDKALVEFYGISDENTLPISQTESSIADTSTGYQDYTQNIDNIKSTDVAVEWPACKKPRIEVERALNGCAVDESSTLIIDSAQKVTDSIASERLEPVDRFVLKDSAIADPNINMVVNQNSKSLSETALERSDAIEMNVLEHQGKMLARNSISSMFPAPVLSDSESNNSDIFEMEELTFQPNLISFRSDGDSPQGEGLSQERTTDKDLLQKTQTETLTQLPVVDLGEDFDLQELLAKPNLSGNGNDKHNALIENINSSTVALNNSEFGKGSKDSKVSKEEHISAAMWSKGQVPGLKGCTDVNSYDRTGHTSLNKNDSEDGLSESCKSYTGFSKFSRDIRPQLLQENPGIKLSEVAKVLANRWKKLSSEERGYYRDLALEDRKRIEKEYKAEKKVAAANKAADKNKTRMLNLLENMRKTNGSKKKNMVMRTIVPWDINRQTVNKFFSTKPEQTSKEPAMIGPLNDNIWTMQFSEKILALNVAALLKGLNHTELSEEEVNSENVLILLRQWLSEKKDDSSIMCALHTIPPDED